MSGYYAGTELPWNGGRPWKIEDDCPAPTHNSLSAARGRAYTRTVEGALARRADVPKCICPGAIRAINYDNAMRRERAANGNVQRQHEGRLGAWVPMGVRMPDMSDGTCASEFGRRIMDDVIDGRGTRGVAAAKDLCSFCPIKYTKCGPYVRKAEQPAGSWAGVWAGMTPNDRKRINA